jgi:feruloyl-CoA synthase
MRLFAEPDIAVERRDDGCVLLRSRTPLEEYEPSMAAVLRRQATETPDRPFLCERTGTGVGEWRTLTFGEAAGAATRIGQALVERGLGPERPVMVLSGNSIEFALLMLGCFTAGVPFVPVSVAYSLMSRDHAQVRHIAGLIEPGLVYVADEEQFRPALDAIGHSATPIAELLATSPGPEVEGAFAAVEPDTVAKVMFTSGSTGLPKGVINTHRMLCANMQMLVQVWPFLGDEPPVLVDWTPWNHTFGGNNDFSTVLFFGGTMYLDDGKPVPGLIERTVANLREVAPTIYLNVPRGFAALMPYLENDDDLAATFFSRLRLIFYAGAALPRDLWDRLDRLARRITGGSVPMTSSWGSTETAPLATAAHFPLDGPGNIGVPVPGTTVKLVPSGSTYELRVRGEAVFPGYWREPDKTAAAFDEEGFYRIGDAARLVDPDDPAAGMLFDGRVAEDFKLTSATWVSVTRVRTGVVSAAAPLLQDVVVCAPDRDEVCALAWLDRGAVERAFGLTGEMAAIVADPDVRKHVQTAIAGYNVDRPGTSSRIVRVLLLADAPSIDANEITDKGYINQRAVLTNRAADVERLYADSPDPDILVI